MTLGKALRSLREARGWTQGQLAIKSQVGQSHISQIERGGTPRPSAEVLSKVATTLGVSLDYLCQEAGWLSRDSCLSHPESAEQRLIDTIRATPSPDAREELLAQLIWIAEVTRDAALARRSKGTDDDREAH